MQYGYLEFPPNVTYWFSLPLTYKKYFSCSLTTGSQFPTNGATVYGGFHNTDLSQMGVIFYRSGITHAIESWWITIGY